MKILPTLLASLLLATGNTAMSQTPAAPATDDPYLWLEDVTGERALAWVRERNAASRRVLEAEPGFVPTRDRIRAILDSKDKIPQITRRGDWFYNLWQDAKNPRGLWRRTTLAEFRKPEPAWETVLDLDALGKAEGENWVWAGATVLGPDYRHALVELSRGGADAAVVREFDTVDKKFVADGFSLPEAKSSVSWETGRDTVLVGTDFGPGSLTDAGYPRIVKRWQRGQPLAQAVTLFEAQKTDIGAWVAVDRAPGFERTVFTRAIDFYRSEQFLLQGAQLVKLPKPEDATASFWRQHAFMELRSDWTVAGRTWPRGSLLVADASAFVAGQAAVAGAVHADRHTFAGRFHVHGLEAGGERAGQRGQPAGGMDTFGHRLDAARGGRAAPWHAERAAAARRPAEKRPAGRTAAAELHRFPDARFADAGHRRPRRAGNAEVPPALLRQHRHARRTALCHQP